MMPKTPREVFEELLELEVGEVAYHEGKIGADEFRAEWLRKFDGALKPLAVEDRVQAWGRAIGCSTWHRFSLDVAVSDAETVARCGMRGRLDELQWGTLAPSPRCRLCEGVSCDSSSRAVDFDARALSRILPRR